MRKGYLRIAAFIAALLTATTLVPAIAATPARAATAVPFTTTRALVVDPGTGRVFVAGDDAVAVLGPDGTLLNTITGVPGAWGMDATQDAIWVNESTAGAIAKIDPVSMTVATTYTVGAPVGDALAIVGATAWIGNRESYSGIGRFDLATSTYSTVGKGYDAPAARRRGTSTTDVIVFSRKKDGAMYRIDAAPPHTVRAEGMTSGLISNSLLDPAGSRLIAPAGRWGYLEEFDAMSLASTGFAYRTDGVRDATSTPAHGGTLAVLTRDTVDVYSAGASGAVASIPVSVPLYPSGVALAPDGSRAYVISVDKSVETVDLHPTATSISASSVVQGVPTSVTVTGRALGGTSAVSVGAASVEPDRTTPTSVEFTVPANAPLGSQAVVLHGSTGEATTTLAVTASTGAVLKGTVRSEAAPVAGAALTLSGGGLATPLHATATSVGGYAFPAIGAGSTYSLKVHDPTGAAPDQVIRGIVLAPNDPTNLDVDLSRPSGDGAEVARTRLSSCCAWDVLVDPASGRTAIAVGDEVEVLDADGLLIARFRGLYSARSLTLLNSKVYVGSYSTGRIARLDLASLAVTGSWPIGNRSSGQVAAAGGKIWFADGNDEYQTLASLDPATGTVVRSTGRYYQPLLTSIVGSPNRFIVSETHISSHASFLIDGSTTTPTEVASVDTFGPFVPPGGNLTAVAATGRLYDSYGYEFRLSDLRPTGVHYDATGPPAFAAGHGGVIAFGTKVVHVGSPSVTHDFGDAATSWGEASLTGIDATGDHLITVEDGDAVVRSLSPIVTSFSPQTLRTPITVTLNGSGLGALSKVTIDGATTPFHDVTPVSVKLDLPSLDGGVHRVVLTTPWGSSATTPLPAARPGPPDQPASTTVSPIVGGLRIEWKAPTYDGHSPITSYKAELSPGGASCTTTKLSCSITGLEPGRRFLAAVRATNAKGTGAASSSYGIVPTIPPAPERVRAYPRERAALIAWDFMPDNVALAVTGYRVCAVTAAEPMPEPSTCPRVSTGPQSRVISPLTANATYRVAVAAVTPVGTGPLSAEIEVTPVDGPVSPQNAFESWDGFATRQLSDFTGQPGTPSTRAAAVAQLSDGTLPPADYIQGLVEGPWYGPAIAPAIRLYWAYFGRIPDHSGLEYWTNKRRSGTTLIRISASFAGSSEFKRTYGALSNTQFVDLVYRNVLGRPGDAGGRAYWIGKLNRGTSRGQVMVNFSESGEYVRKQGGSVGVVEAFAGMLDRAPTLDDLDRWRTEPLTSLIEDIRLRAEYADRVG